MREMKFRVWDKKRKNWVPDFMTAINSQGKLVCCNSDKNLGPWKIDCEIVFYTGLKDKNGKEIYEGDIVKCTFNNVSNWGTKIVEWKDCGFNIPKRDCWVGSHNDFDTWGDIQYEIIGNIYENPELM